MGQDFARSLGAVWAGASGESTIQGLSPGMDVAATAQITGVLLVFALLVAPAAAARQLTARIGLGLALTAAIGLVVTWVGLGLAYFTDRSSGFYVTTLAFGIYLTACVGRWLARRLG